MRRAGRLLSKGARRGNTTYSKGTLTSFSFKTTTPLHVESRRFLNVHEYLSQELMRQENIKVPRGKIAHTAEEAYQIASDFEKEGIQDMVVKAQVLSGGRGLGHFDSGLKSGIHLTTSPEDVRDVTSKMLGHKLITKQTGAEGKICNKVYVAERLFVRRETYVAILMDRASCGPVIVGSSKGGTNIEQISEEHPESIFKVPIDINKGITPDQCKEVANKLGFTSSALHQQATSMIQNLYNLFIKRDCTLAEVNPLVEDHQHQLFAVDAKLNFDDNAEFRQTKTYDLRDKSQEDTTEVQATDCGLNYIKLDGNIGCLVNGAGLAMATMDIIKHYGGTPANFLDIGGGATEKQVTEAFRILSSDKNVRAILVNIFGGIMRCDIIAYGILNAVNNINLKIPLVVRLSGTKVDEAKHILKYSGVRVLSADNLDDAAATAVNVAKIVSMAEQVKLKVSLELPI
eukprot:TRINITY_DN3429_c0_g1_i1.p1 TRINITY_DN3429_c0_g1~~TRINITY_DN3429_c0_g1_i1.p1  ORF type:complete len:458 (-),score=136.83 TRINITY_DN3429_c0_g1_i1:214-1587(-)